MERLLLKWVSNSPPLPNLNFKQKSYISLGFPRIHRDTVFDCYEWMAHLTLKKEETYSFMKFMEDTDLQNGRIYKPSHLKPHNQTTLPFPRLIINILNSYSFLYRIVIQPSFLYGTEPSPPTPPVKTCPISPKHNHLSIQNPHARNDNQSLLYLLLELCLSINK